MKIKLGNVLEINNVLKQIIDNSELKIDALFKFRLLGIMKNLEESIVGEGNSLAWLSEEYSYYLEVFLLIY